MEIQDFITKYLSPATSLLESAFHIYEGKYPKPIFVVKNSKLKWRYENPQRENACILKSVAVISGLNSINHLLSGGCYQEIQIVLRTIHESLDDIHFLLIGYNEKELSEIQKRYLKEYFKEEFINSDIPYQGTTEKEFIPRKKILAEIGRDLGNYSNPTDVIKLNNINADINSGYIHAAYSQMMDLYGGEPPFSKFYLSGCLNTPRIISSFKSIASVLNQSLAITGLICIKFNCIEIGIELMDKRKSFEKSDPELFPTGNIDSNKYLLNIKKGKV